MRSTVRWVLSPDRRALIAVEDAVSVEADPLPDAFLYASEATGASVQVDNVWDVAPSPSWGRIAFGRAFVLRAGERDTMPETEWARLEAQLPEDVADRDAERLRRDLRRHAFPASGMALMLGLGMAQVMDVSRLPAGLAAAPTGATLSLHGWRTRWTRTGDTLAVGAAPRQVQDDADPARWVLVRPVVGASYRDSIGATTDPTRLAAVSWTEGPTLELASPMPTIAERAIPIEGGEVVSRAGTIELLRPGAAPVIVGRGWPLAATATGRFILALVPRADTVPGTMAARPVVYHVSRE